MLSDHFYRQLAEALNKLGARAKRLSQNPSNVEMRLLKKISSIGEASLASQLSGSPESVEAIANRMELPTKEAKGKLSEMAKQRALQSCAHHLTVTA